MPETVTSLIIITLRRPALLQKTLEGLLRQSRPLDEIVVIDNGPDAETEKVVRDFGARYVPEPRRGYGCARNRGLAEARGDILYFLDDDCVAEAEWAENLWEVLESGRADLAGGARVSGRTGLAAHLEYLSTDGPVLSPHLPAGTPRHLSTSNLILRREAVERTGRFDEGLAMCEDRDFTARARDLGFRLQFVPSALVTHYSSVTRMKDYLARMRHYGFGTSQYFVQRPQEPLARIFPRNATARLLLLPFLAAAGTLYLAMRNQRRYPYMVVLMPFLFLGQLAWHWGGWQAMRSYNRKQ